MGVLMDDRICLTGQKRNLQKASIQGTPSWDGEMVALADLQSGEW